MVSKEEYHRELETKLASLPDVLVLKKRKCEILNSELLKNEYIENKMSIYEIGRKYDITGVYVYYLLKKYNILIRNLSDSTHISALKRRKHINFIDKQLIDYMDGLLISDGHIRELTRMSTNYFYSQTCKYKEWLDYISNFLSRCGITSVVGHDGRNAYCLYTSGYPELEYFHCRWYRNNKKILPRDIDLNPVVLANWYMGDGSMHRDYEHSNRTPYPLFSCSEFDMSDKLWLINILEKRYGFTGWINNGGIYIHTAHTWNFVKLIYPYIISCYNYKIFRRVNQRELERM